MDRYSGGLTANLGTKFVSLVIAVVLWFIVLGSRNVEVSKEVPLEIVTPSDLVPSNEVPDKIVFRLAGPKAFLRTILDRREDPIRVNMTGAKPGLVTYRFFSDNIHLPIGVKVLSINPAAILIKLEAVKKREVPVRIELRGVPPEGFRLVSASLTPPAVRIKGAESRVDAIAELPTVPVDVSETRANEEREIALEIARYNVQIDGPTPKLHLEVQPTTANFRIKNVDVRVVASFPYRLEEKTVTVLVHIAHKDLRLLDRSRVFAVIDLTGKPRGRYNEKVKVTLPDGVGMVKVVPDRVNVTLQ